MKFDYTEAEEYEVDFANTGEITFDELEDCDAAELAQLVAELRAERVLH